MKIKKIDIFHTKVNFNDLLWINWSPWYIFRQNLIFWTISYNPNHCARVGKLEDQNNTPEVIFERADDIKLLWESEPIQITYERRNEFQIVECAKYFLSRVHEVLAPDYIPTDQDLLQTRQRTIGIVEYKFEMEGAGRKRTLIMVCKTFLPLIIPLPYLIRYMYKTNVTNFLMDHTLHMIMLCLILAYPNLFVCLSGQLQRRMQLSRFVS